MKALFAALLVALWPLAGAAQGVTLTPEELRAVAVQLLREGNVPEALRLAQLLLERDPADDIGLYVKAEAALVLGHPEIAARAGRAAFRATEEDRLRFQAARLTALAEAQSGHPTWAQLWLRRATPYVPDVEARRALEQDYQALRAANPLSLSFGFGLTPTQNVNGGSEAETIELPLLPGIDFVLSGDARPLSGLEVNGAANIAYRLAESERTRTTFNLQAQGRTYALSPQAQRQAPDVNGSDFSDSAISVGFTHVVAPESGPRQLTYSAAIGQMWYGGDPLRQFLRLGHDRQYVLENSALTLSFTAEYLMEDGIEDYWQLGLRARQSFAPGEIGRLSLTYGFSSAMTSEPDRGYDGLTIGADYDLEEPLSGIGLLGPTGVSFGASLDARRFDDTIYARGERGDLRGRAYLSLDLPKYEIYGFTPRVTIEASHTWSNVEFFERDDMRLGISFSSAF
ncbi:hypothetical protein [Pseudoroseicyclus sp. CXY001]|uniref:hypothetical protein n=1 Tax=Pseudoroseicyclus sp. CXY001 TaxID=3242492 RepID=UPI003570CE55